MGRIIAYLVVAYVAFVLFMTLLLSARLLLFLLLLLVFLFFRFRRGSWARYVHELEGPRALPWSRRELEPGPPPSATGRELQRLRGAAERLGREFPENRLENAALVSVLALYTHEPAEERERVEQEFDSWRDRFVAWRQRLADFGGAGDPTALEEERAALEAYVDELRRRAAEADELPQRALDEVTRAGALIEAARAACAGVSESSPLVERLDAAVAKHAEAWGAVGGEASRPMTARRLAAEATELAGAVQEEAVRVAALPGDVRHRLQELGPALEHMREELDLVEAEVRSAATSYAVSSWREIGGVGNAAREAVERAARLHAAAAEEAGSRHLERAARALDDAEAALAEAERLRGAIDAHLRKLETAALEARERVVSAEKEVDRAQGREPDERVERAAELVREARAKLEGERPDWLAIVELSDRAAELARGAGAAPEPAADDRSVAEARARAEEARETALAWAIVAPAAAEHEHALLEEANQLFREASDDPTERAIERFAAAEQAAEAFTARVQARRGPKGGREEAAPQLGHALVWDLAVRFSTRG